MKELWELYISFFRIGILTFGGGLAMLPMLKYELVEKRNWIKYIAGLLCDRAVYARDYCGKHRNLCGL